MVYSFFQFSVYLFLLLVFYHLVLRRLTHFSVNRIYLLAIVPVSFALTFLPGFGSGVIRTVQLPLVEVNSAMRSMEPGNSLSRITIIYFTGVLFFLSVFLFRLVSLLRLMHLTYRKEGVYRIIENKSVRSPASFFRYIFIPAGLEDRQREVVFAHEKAHAEHLHSMDILWMELIRILVFFQPLVYWVKRELLILHEFEADAAVMQTVPTADYKRILLNTVLEKPSLQLTHSFGKSNLLIRFHMMNKQQSGRWASWKVALALPLVAVSAMAFTVPSMVRTAVAPQLSLSSIQTGIVNPEYKGGQEAMIKFIGANLVYPESSKTKKEEGTVYVSFLVSKTGKLGDIKVKRGVSEAIDKEAVRVVKLMPDWTPGTKDGIASDFEMVLPIQFRLK